MRFAALRPRELWSMGKETVQAWLADFAPSMGAGIAFYTIFSLAPLVLIVIAIAGFFWGNEAASGYVYAQLGDLVGEPGAEAVRESVRRAGETDSGFLGPIVGFAVLLVGATTVFAELQADLDRVWKAPAAKAATGIFALVRKRVLSLGLVVSIGFLMLVSLVFSAALAALGKWWSGWFEQVEWLLHGLDLAVSVLVISVMFALMYKILPRVKIGWPDVWIGAIATALLFTLGKFLLGLYIGKSRVVTTYGTAGSLVVILLWVYYSAQIFLLGAEFTWVYAHRHGSRRGQDKPSTTKETLATEPEPGSPGVR